MASAVQTTNQDLGPPTADSLIFKGTVVAAEQRFALAGFKGRHITVANEGAELLRERLAADVEIDANTARQLFTLICVLNLR